MSSAARPPAWLIVVTAAMAAILLAMAVGETSLQGQYLIDQGEYLSLVGLAFILVAGLYLHKQGRLLVSMPLVLPWLFYPIITQGDQIIDNLTINPMRWVVHVLLAVIFGMPVAVIALTARYARPRYCTRPRTALLAAVLLALEMILAYLFLGTLMFITLIVMIAAVLAYGARDPKASSSPSTPGRRAADRVALVALVTGVAFSAALYLGFKNRPGAYQGSPSFYMDPSQPAAGFDLAAVAVPSGQAVPPAAADDVRTALSAYADSLQTLLDGYYILDRNYNHHFHNELFLRSTPLLANYRPVGLASITAAGARKAEADERAAAARGSLAADDPLAALLDDVRAYVAFNFKRAATLERMSAEFERTPAGLQHATHIYEGEGKYLGVELSRLLDKHRAVLTSAGVSAVVGDFVAKSRAIHDRYANRIVGF